MKATKARIIIAVAVNIFFAQTSLHAVDSWMSRILKTAAAFTAFGTASTVALMHPSTPAAFVAGATAGGIMAAGAHYTGRYAGVVYDDTTSRRFISAAGTLGFGIGTTLHTYIPNTTAAGTGYVLACGTLATLSCRRLDNLVEY